MIDLDWVSLLLGFFFGAGAVLSVIHGTCHVWRRTPEEQKDSAERAYEHEMRCGGWR